jgi:hypothetical protein
MITASAITRGRHSNLWRTVDSDNPLASLSRSDLVLWHKCDLTHFRRMVLLGAKADFGWRQTEWGDSSLPDGQQR